MLNEKQKALSVLTATDRTKEYIIQALFALMKTMPFEAITVTDITKKAGVGRATYYRHFADKEEVIRYYFEQEVRGFMPAIAAAPAKKDDFYEVIFKVFSGMKEKRGALDVIMRTHLEHVYLDFLNEAMIATCRERWASVSDYAAYYMAGCLFNVSLAWVRGGCAESVKSMADMYFSLLFLDERRIFG